MILFARTYLAYFILFLIISVFVGLHAILNGQSFVDVIIYWLAADAIIALVVVKMLVASDYFTGRLKDKLK